MNRDLDAEIAEKVYGWKLVKVGSDIDGKNACVILWKTAELPKDVYAWLPRKGSIHRGYLVPEYSSNREHAIKLAVKVGLKMDISEINFSSHLFAEELAKRSLEYFQANKAGRQ